MKTTILIDLNALPEDLEAQAVAMIDAMGAIEAAFVGRVLGELSEKLTAFTKEEAAAAAEENGGLEYGVWKMTPVAGRKIYDYSQVMEWNVLNDEKKAAAEAVKELEGKLQKTLPFERAVNTYQFKCAVKPKKLGGAGMTAADDSSPIQF
jgi:hypothetical protein